MYQFLKHLENNSNTNPCHVKAKYLKSHLRLDEIKYPSPFFARPIFGQGFVFPNFFRLGQIFTFLSNADGSSIKNPLTTYGVVYLVIFYLVSGIAYLATSDAANFFF